MQHDEVRCLGKHFRYKEAAIAQKRERAAPLQPKGILILYIGQSSRH